MEKTNRPFGSRDTAPVPFPITSFTGLSASSGEVFGHAQMLSRKQNTHGPAPSLEMPSATHVALSLHVLIGGPHIHEVLFNLKTGTAVTTPSLAVRRPPGTCAVRFRNVARRGFGVRQKLPGTWMTSDGHGSEDMSSVCALPAFPVQGDCEPSREGRLQSPGGLPRATAGRGLVASWWPSREELRGKPSARLAPSCGVLSCRAGPCASWLRVPVLRVLCLTFSVTGLR